MTDSPRVVFAMEWVPQYRAVFYQRLRDTLAERGITMELIHGDPPSSRRRRKDARVLPWATYVPNRHWSVGGLELTHQPVLDLLADADLIVTQQETGLVINYPLLLRARRGRVKLALWGHGHNFNPLDANPVAERVKEMVTRHASWFFAYTEQSEAVFRSIGADPDRITVVQNSMDTAYLSGHGEPPSPDIKELCQQLSASAGRVGWMVSALDRWKRLEFLIEILDRIESKVDGFAFIVLGAGDDADIVSRAAASRPWLHYPGPRFDADKAALAEVASFTVHPGLAGLHVIESFATATPMITEDLAYHSHEVAYLSDDNSIVLPRDAGADLYGRAVAELVTDPTRLAALQAGCRRAAVTYSLEAMVDNFATGVEAALAAS